MAGIQAPWVGKTPEEREGKKEFIFNVTMTGEISIYATSYDNAESIVKEMSNQELLDCIDNVEID